MPNYHARNTMKKKSPLERIERKTIKDPVTGCWLFTGSKNQGHGQIYMGAHMKPQGVHRISAVHYLGYDLNSPLQVNHKQICPNKNCWNPEHLYIGSQGDNTHDSLVMGTHANQHGNTAIKQSEK